MDHSIGDEENIDNVKNDQTTKQADSFVNDNDENMMFDIPDLGQKVASSTDAVEVPSKETTLPSDTSSVNDSNNMTKEFQAAISNNSPIAKAFDPISPEISTCNMFDEESSNKFSELESKISDILSNISQSETPNSGIKENEGLEKTVHESDETSNDGANDGDALGLLAESEERERHYSEPDEDDEEEDLEMIEEHLDSEDPESDGIMEEDDENSKLSDNQESVGGADDNGMEKNDETQLQLHSEIDETETESHQAFQSDTDTLDASDINVVMQKDDGASPNINELERDEPIMSICNVTSLASTNDSNAVFDNDATMMHVDEKNKKGDQSAETSNASNMLSDVLSSTNSDWDKPPKTESDANNEQDDLQLDTEMSNKCPLEKSKLSEDVDKTMDKTHEPVPKDNDMLEESEVSTLLPIDEISIEKSEPMDYDNDLTTPLSEIISAISAKTIKTENDNSISEQDLPDLHEASDVGRLLDSASNEDMPEIKPKVENMDVNMKDDTVNLSSDGEPVIKTNINNEKSTPQDVYLLDSDDETTTAPSAESNQTMVITTPEKTDVIKPPEKKPKYGDKCINPICNTFDKLSPCPLFVPSVFRARDVPNTPKTCDKCLNMGVSVMEKLVSKLKMGKCLLDVDIPSSHDLVEISDSDSDDETKTNGRPVKGGWRKKGIPKPSEDELLKVEEKNFINQQFTNAFNEVWQKYDVNRQIEMCQESLVSKMDALDAECADLEKLINQEQVELDLIRKNLYESFRHPTECRSELIITETGSNIVMNPLSDRRSTRLRKQNIGNKQADPPTPAVGNKVPNPENVDPHPKRTADSVVVTDTVGFDTLPPPGRLPDYALILGMTVYAVRQSIFGAWCLAKIVRIMPRGTKLANGTLSQFSLITVHFLQGGESEQVTKQVTGRQVAMTVPISVIYPVGTRVIALFQNKQQLKEAYYSGVIAELATKASNYRYLVFFDDGYSRYVYHNFILLVCQRSAHAWEDVHPDSRDFIRKYFNSFPNQPMVRLQPGHSIRAEYKGKFLMASVVAVDGSLALIKFNDVSGVPVNHEEWIYRGSTRLQPLFLELQNADRKAQGRHRTSYASTNLNKSKNFPYVEYSRPEISEESSAPVESDTSVVNSVKNKEEQTTASRAVAKKSTVNREDTAKIRDSEEVPTQQVHADQVKSKVVYYSPKVTIQPKKLTPHICEPNCLNKDAIALRELRTYNPLARPLLSGWQRLIIKYRGKRTIMYKSPCGRRLRNAKELHLYLRLTHSQMSVDLFDFDFWVHCLAEFVPTKCFVSKKDLSHGVEAVPIPCVNYYDHTLPEFSAYSTRRIPTKGVNLNLDEEFLCGCDCTDDCQDKSQCQCWQLTLEGASIIGSPVNRVGYQYKRLLEPVPTGIYECNSRCKCAATCLNRVVQHPLQLKLQVFKTFNRGWGIRALNDVSRGTFICIYAGNLLTDAVANVDGVTEGDEYLAELDYIEVVEKLKENYESDVPEEDKDFDEDSSEQSDNEKKTKDKRSGVHGESDEEFVPQMKISTEAGVGTRQLRKKKSGKKETCKGTEPENTKEEKKKEEVAKNDSVTSKKDERSNSLDEDGAMPVVDEFITISDDEEKREPSRFAAPDDLQDNDQYVPKHRSVRSFFGKDEACYIMDAKVQGNLGRYLNHSCSPNVFVQNVFVDTHDPRFPWVAFFTLTHVRAGAELTWNYNYDVGSVPGKVIFCRCGAPHCRGRLL